MDKKKILSTQKLYLPSQIHSHFFPYKIKGKWIITRTPTNYAGNSNKEKQEKKKRSMRSPMWQQNVHHKDTRMWQQEKHQAHLPL